MSFYTIDGLASDSAYDVDGLALPDVYDINGNRIGPRFMPPAFLDTAVLTALPTITVGGKKQGACSDGTYIYQACADTPNYVIKYKISDGTFTYATFENSFGHANDMAYNPNNGYLYICTMESDGSVIVLDSTDLSYVDTVYLVNGSGNAYAVWQLCFDQLSNRFLSVNGNNICIYDQSFNYITSIAIPTHPDATGQGCETDGYYFYRITYNPNYIDVIKLSDGTRVKTMSNPLSGEPETMMYDWNGHYYINQYSTTQALFYSAQLFES